MLKRSLAMRDDTDQSVFMGAKRRKPESVGKKIKKAIEKAKEKKFFDTSALGAGSVISTTPFISRLSSIPQGPGDSERIGDAITVTSIEHRLTATWAANSMLRVIVFQWKADNTTAPTVTSILETNVGGTNWYVAPYCHDTASQYRIIDDFHLEGTTSGFPVGVSYRKYFGKKFSKDLRFLAAGTDGYNAIYYLMVSNQSAGGGLGPSVVNRTRINYSDA